jgi:hypothetical protein
MIRYPPQINVQIILLTDIRTIRQNNTQSVMLNVFRTRTFSDARTAWFQRQHLYI